MSRPRALVVDDEPDIRELLAITLERMGIEALAAEDLVRLGIADEIVPEPLGGAHRDPATVIASVGERITAALDQLADEDGQALVEARYARLRAIGEYSTGV